MKYFSVCSGMESATLAWHPLGWQAVGFSEINPFAAHVLHHHYSSGRPRFMPSPDEADLSDEDRKERTNNIKAVRALPERANGIPNYGDMSRFQEWSDVPDFDVLVGGTPCQSFSIAGLRKGLDDPRGNLMLTYVAIARRYRPKICVWENVPGVLSDDEGRAFGSLLGLLSGQRIEVPSGGWETAGIVEGYKGAYGLAWRVLDAQFIRVDGIERAVPQRRRRVIVVGYIGDWRRAAAILFERESMSGNPPPRRQAGKGFAIDVAPSLVGSGRGVERAGDTRGQDPLVAEVAHSLRADGFDAGEDGTGRGTPLIPEVANPLTARMAKGVNTTMDEGQTMVPVAFDSKASGRNGFGISEETSPTLRAMGHAKSHQNAGGQVAVAFDMRGREGGAQFEGPHDTANIRASEGGSSRSYVLNMAVRRLMPVECERLQGAPDGYTNVPWRGSDESPDGQRYKILGNAMAVNKMRWLGRRIEMVLAIPMA